ncbi:BA75_01167T0 [Komagataella pastoris]|uniref:Ubiquitin fusion degradation protein 1 n=1 Tax=Komagataella pastoris TaxID=4922 RepID=A0A1B2J8Y7_PICPA|nr:BA75_01167T0 [Komagataella pastoris]
MFSNLGQAFFRAQQASGFEDYFRCYPVSMMPGSSSREVANFGGKIFLPPSTLHKLTMLHISYPMLFELTNQETGRSTHSGVLEFLAEEGRCYLPQWMMSTLGIQTGGLLKIKNCDLPLGSFVKIEPQSVDFLEISDPKAVLENVLRNFTTLTVDDIFEVSYNNKVFGIKVLEVKPESSSHGICVIETDLETDFAPPVGYVEPDYKKEKKQSQINPTATNPGLVGQGSMAKKINYSDLLKQEPNATNFQGSGVKLSGKTVKKEEVVSPDTSGLSLEGQPAPLILPDNQLFFGYPLKPYKGDNETDDKNTNQNPLFAGQGQTLRKSKKRKDKSTQSTSTKDKTRSPDAIIIDSD